jgi:hypothetical protein
MQEGAGSLVVWEYINHNYPARCYEQTDTHTHTHTHTQSQYIHASTNTPTPTSINSSSLAKMASSLQIREDALIKITEIMGKTQQNLAAEEERYQKIIKKPSKLYTVFASV